MVTSVAMTAEVTKTFAGSTTGGSTAKPVMPLRQPMLARTSAVLEVTPDEAFDSDAASNVALAVLRMSTLINTTPTPMLSARAAKSGTDRPASVNGRAPAVALSRIHWFNKPKSLPDVGVR